MVVFYEFKDHGQILIAKSHDNKNTLPLSDIKLR